MTTFDPARGDHPANFVRVADADVVDTDANGIDVSPQATFEVGSDTPLDLASLQNLQISTPFANVVVRVFARDSSNRSFRVVAPLGLCLTPESRAAILAQRDRPPSERDASCTFTVVGGRGGVRSAGGVELPASLAFRFVLDPAAPDNVVGWVPVLRRKRAGAGR